MNKLIIFLISFAISALSFGQSSPTLIPSKISINQGNCDSSEIYKSELLRAIEDFGYQSNSKFYNDNVQSVDLNNDGVCEYILKYYDGGAYFQEEIYKIQDSNLVKIINLQENTYYFLEKYNDWPQIIVKYFSGHKTNPIWQFMLYRYNGKEYEKYYDPNLNYGSMVELGINAYKNKDYKSAEIFFRNILTVYGNDKPVDINNLAMALFHQNKTEECKTLLIDELSQRKNSITFYNLSLVYKKEKNIKQELYYLKKSNELQSSINKQNRIAELEEILKSN